MARPELSAGDLHISHYCSRKAYTDIASERPGISPDVDEVIARARQYHHEGRCQQGDDHI